MKPENVRVGAAWKRETKEGASYLSGKLNNDMNVAIFKNDNKKEEKHPDYIFRMSWEQAESLGLISEYDWNKAKEEKGEEIDISNF